MEKITELVSNMFSFIKPNLEFDSVSKSGIKSLYRFTYFDTKTDTKPELYYQDLLKNILFFPSKSQLNDPFDAQIPTKYELCSEKALYEYVKNLITKKLGNIANIDEKVSELIKKLRHNPQTAQDNLDEGIEQKVGILSLTERVDNLLLWAHYSSKHTGFCVEFDAQLLNNIVKSEFIKNGELAFLFKVKYQRKFPIINPCELSIDQRTQLQFLIKSKDWKYEKEWRILLLSGSKQKRELPAGVIKNIFFGLNARDDKILICKELLKQHNPKISLFKAVKKKDTFGLDFNKFEL